MGKIRAKMPPSRRAKQFAPFDAVVGLRQALKEKEKIRVTRRELFEDITDEINNTLKILNTSDTVTVVYYNEFEQEYATISGLVQKINPKSQKLTVAEFDIKFEDIYTISKY